MALLNPPQILPNAAHLIYKYLGDVHPARVSREQLRDVLTPFARSDDDRRILWETLKACLEIGLITEVDGNFGLAAEPSARTAQFRSLARSLIFDRGRNRDLWKEGAHGPSQQGARDFVRAVSWFLSLDIYTTSGRYDNLSGKSGGVHELAAQDFGAWNPITNLERWQSFIRWSTFLGLATALPQGRSTLLFPDPTVAVRDVIRELPDQAASRKPQPLASFLAVLAESLPIIDGGSFSSETLAQTRRNLPTGEVSPSLSHALLRLSDSHEVELSSLADAGKLILRPGARSEVTYSHVRVVGVN